MAILHQCKTPDEMRKLGVAATRKAYDVLAVDYNRMIDREVLMCPYCGKWLDAERGFYLDRKYATNRFPLCKQCVQKQVEQRVKDNDEPNETKESVQFVLRQMDKPYDDGFYSTCVKDCKEQIKENTRSSPFATYITAIQSLPNWRGKTWKDSKFGDSTSIDEEVTTNRKPRREIIKLFGYGFSDLDYLFLQDQYDDWRSRTQVDSKSQETYVMQICLQLLDIDKKRKSQKDVTKEMKTLDDLMNSANLQPKQNVNNSATDSLTFSQLIEKWEAEGPIPELPDDKRDIDGIGKMFKGCLGWLCKALGVENEYTREYEEELTRYSVNKDSEEVEDDVSDDIYSAVFGSGDN